MSQRNAQHRTRFALLPFLVALFVLAVLFYQNGAKWLRFVLIYLSHASWAREIVTGIPIAQHVSRRFVAGEEAEEAIEVARNLNETGMTATLDFLGESVDDAGIAQQSADEIIDILDSIESNGVNANVSVKLSQLGLRIDEQLALDNMRRILTHAGGYGNKVRIDMEESDLVDTTLALYRKLRDDDGFMNVGVVIQSYLFRSQQDVRELVDEGAWIRLCKGAYAEPPDVAFPKKVDTDRNFIELTEMMLSENARNNGVFLGIATHDEIMIEAALDYIDTNHVSPHLFEFQMLYGIRRELQKKLVRDGFQVRVYVPYGSAWYPYLVRRLAEHPANLWFFVSNFFRN